MGISTSPAQLAAKLEAFGTAQPEAAHQGVVGATKVVRDTIVAELGSHTHGTGRLSGVGKKGARLGVKTVIGTTTAAITAVGPWQFIEGDTRRHDIRPGRTKSGRRKKNGAGALKIGGGLYASAKNTGGSQGKHPWAKGTVISRPLAAKAFDVAEAATLKEVFR